MVAAPVSQVLSKRNNSNTNLLTNNEYICYSSQTSALKSANFNKKSKHIEKVTSNDYDLLKKETIEAISSRLKKCENDDLARLSNLNEQTVLDQLKLRFSKNKIYVKNLI